VARQKTKPQCGDFSEHRETGAVSYDLEAYNQQRRVQRCTAENTCEICVNIGGNSKSDTPTFGDPR